MLTNYELKLRARTALKDNWPIALMVALIAALPSLIHQVLSVLAMNSDGASYAFNQLLDAFNIGYIIMSKLEGALETLNHIFMPTMIVMLLSSLITPALTLGQMNYGMKLLRGDEDALIGTVFSRMNRFLRALGLSLMIYLRTALWMLPGLAIEILAGVVLGLGGADLTWLFFILCYGGMIAMMVLGIRAALHYSMATFAMAEEPSRGINQCIRLSVSIMRRRKLLLFSLELSFIGYFLVLALVNTLLSALLGNVLGSTVYMALSMALNVYVMVAECAFYQAYRDQPL